MRGLLRLTQMYAILLWPGFITDGILASASGSPERLAFLRRIIGAYVSRSTGIPIMPDTKQTAKRCLRIM